MTNKPTVEIFRAGRHTATNGQTISFSNADIEAMAAVYAPATHEAPAVVGHPKEDAPAYAWAGKLIAKDGRLSAELDQVDPAFAEMVSAGRFKKISAAFYAPDQVENPTPGKFYLRHIGFLGAQPPAVKGLKQVEFSEDATTLVFAEDPMPWILSSIARLFRGFRESIIADKGIDEANKIIGDWDIQSIEDASVRLQAQSSPSYSEHNPQPPENANLKTPEQREAELAEREAAVATREGSVTAQQAAFAEAEKKRKGVEDVALIDQLAKDGKISPAIKPQLILFMSGLDDGTTLAFAEGADAPKITHRAFFRDLLSKAGTIVSFAEASKPGDDAVDENTDPMKFGETLAAEATAFIQEQAKLGNTISADVAMRHVQDKRKKA